MLQYTNENNQNVFANGAGRYTNYYKAFLRSVHGEGDASNKLPRQQHGLFNVVAMLQQQQQQQRRQQQQQQLHCSPKTEKGHTGIKRVYSGVLRHAACSAPAINIAYRF